MDIDVKKLEARVRDSALITKREKAYWLERLDTMTDPQIEKLDRILSEAEIIAWTPKMSEYVDVIQRGQTASLPA